MGMFDYFRASREPSATVAKERLQIIVAHERAERNRPSYLPTLQKELLEVIRKYVHVDPADVQVSVDKNKECEILALNVVLPGPGAAQARRA
jgi:cell division topological specificity factor